MASEFAKGIDLLELRRRRLERINKTAEPEQIKPEKLTAEGYLRRQFSKYGEGDEQIKVILLWRSKKDKKGRARIKFYSPSQSRYTKHFFVLIWHDKDSWLHEIIPDSRGRRDVLGLL